MKRHIIYLILFSSLALTGCSPWLMERDERLDYLQHASRQYLRGMFLKGSSWSILAVDLDKNRVLLNYDANRSLIPASGIKLLTTACALESLGPEYRIVTELGYTGSVDSAGTLHGDLIVRGAGDPTISTRYIRTYSDQDSVDLDETLRTWADSIRVHGIRSIDGDLIGYSGIFGGDPFGSGWEWDDLKYSFAAEISPLVYADGFVDITVTPGPSAGSPARIDISPNNDFLHLYSNVITSDSGTTADIHFNRTISNNIFSLWGTIPLGSNPWREEAAVYDANSFFLSAFTDLLEQNEIEVKGQISVKNNTTPDIADSYTVLKHWSQPLSQIIQIINQDSQNIAAELLLRVLGAEMIARSPDYAEYTGDAFRSGRKKVLEWEASLPGSSTGVVMVDGSGLSRRNLTSASGLVKVLTHMYRSPHRNAFIHSLATPGAGTLENRFLGLPQGIYLQAKTGSMARIRTLSGYLTTTDGPRIAFSIMCNNYLCSSEEVEAAMENICQLLALYLKGE